MMQYLLIFGVYLGYAAFCVRFLLHAYLWWKGTARPAVINPGRSRSIGTCLRGFGDVFLFYRLLRTNDVLWAGELLFHGSLLLVLLRHLRLFLDPVPGWVWALQPWGVIAGYLLPFTLVYILVIRLLTEQVKYSSPGNLFLLVSLLIISLTGLFMHAWWKPDIIGIKEFLLGIFLFRPVPWPGGWLSTLHLVAVLVIIPYLPTHIFIAPAVMIEARSREEGLHEVLHGR